MLRNPKRAVTRFFIPLIDVLLLMFCVFLLMPYVEKGALGGARLTAGQAEQLKRRIAQLEEKLEQAGKNRETPEELKQENDRLKKLLRQNPVDRLLFRSLEIDENNGGLFYFKATADGDSVRVRLDEEKSRQIVADDRKPPFRQAEQKLVYIIVRPQKKSLFPTSPQRREYEGWFRGLPVELRWADQPPGLGGRNT